MPLARPLPERRRLAREVTTYGIVAIINTAIDFALFNGLISLGALKANSISTIVATTTSFLMNRHWVYRDRPKTALHREYTMFFGVNLVGLVIQEVVLAVAGLGVHDMSANRLLLNLFKCLGVAVAMIFRFWAYRTFVFRPHPRPPADTTSSGGAAIGGHEAPPAVSGQRAPAPNSFDALTAPLEIEFELPTDLTPTPELDGDALGGAALS
ncbi:hypothetical protein GCM10023322_23880 [Rugosimonospora acidiphila]|uniref:GtrA/DPMS transmembrane domain-containing protein n=1 Tax=Rugosimonospora acidiphila TaxID=556531 RepID=A0ABP9RRP0_9ACTN